MRRGLLAGGLAAVLGLGWWGWGALAAAGPDEMEEQLTATVRRGTLAVTVEEHGTIEAGKRITISNELRWPVIIEEIIEDGTLVEANQVIVRFSCKQLDDEITKQELTLRDANSGFQQAEANYKLKQQEVAEKLRKARQAVQDAKDDEKRYLEGSWPIKKREQAEAIRLKEWELKIASESLNFKLEAGKRLGSKSPYTDSEIESDRLSLDRQRLDLAKLKAQFDLLTRYDHPKEARKYATGVREAELALQRAEIDASIELQKARDLVQTREDTLARHTKEMEKLKEDELNQTVRAERRGLVVYETRRNRWDNSDVTVAKGETLKPGQQIMIIPDMTTLQVKTKVFESMVKWVKPGSRATVRLETDPMNPLAAEVSKVSPMPERDRWWSAGVTYGVVVKLAEDQPDLKPNMTAEVTLHLAEVQDAICVPVAAVFSEDDQAYCYVVDGGQETRKVPVKVGELSNDKEVQVLSGVEPGQRVLLIEPPETDAPFADEPADEDLPGLAG